MDKKDPEAEAEAGARSEAADGADALRGLQDAVGLDTRSITIWATSPERSWYLARRHNLVRTWVVPLAAAATLAAAAFIWLAPEHERLGQLIALVGGLALVGLAWSAMPYWAARRAFRERRRATAAYRVDVALREVSRPRPRGKDGVREALQLSGLFELNRRQLDEYQELTKRQQRVAFGLTWAAATAAFLVLVGGTVLSLRQDPGSAQYVVGGLTGLGTLLSGFLGKTFFDQHGEAIRQLNRYYREPSRTGRLLAAERLIRDLDKTAADECRQLMVENLLNEEAGEPVEAKKPDEVDANDDGDGD